MGHGNWAAHQNTQFLLHVNTFTIYMNLASTNYETDCCLTEKRKKTLQNCFGATCQHL